MACAVLFFGEGGGVMACAVLWLCEELKVPLPCHRYKWHEDEVMRFAKALERGSGMEYGIDC